MQFLKVPVCSFFNLLNFLSLAAHKNFAVLVFFYYQLKVIRLSLVGRRVHALEEIKEMCMSAGAVEVQNDTVYFSYPMFVKAAIIGDHHQC